MTLILSRILALVAEMACFALACSDLAVAREESAPADFLSHNMYHHHYHHHHHHHIMESHPLL